MRLPWEWHLFGIISAGTGMMQQNNLSRDELRRRLIVLLLESGVPLKNLFRYRGYYRFGSFVFVDGLPTYFVALMRQSDCGLGLMPVSLKHPQLVSELLSKLRHCFDLTPERAIFGDFDFSRRALGAFVRSLLEKSDGNMPPSAAFRMLDRGATFVSLLRVGGFLTAAIRDELLLPANYYHIGDLLEAMGIPRAKLTGIDGNRWRNPYAPTRTQLNRALNVGSVLDLLTAEPEQKRGKGRPRQLPKHLRAAASCYKTWSIDTWAAFVAYFWPQPSVARIRELLVKSGTSEAKGAWAKAGQIFNAIWKSGRLASARPLRLINPAKLLSFLDHAEAVYLPKVIETPEKQRRVLAVIRTIAAIGCRPQEALKVRQRDFTTAGKFRLLLVRGTKVHRARREPPLHPFAAGPCGTDLYDRFQEAVEACSLNIAESHPLFAGSKESAERYDAVNDVLRSAFEGFTGEDRSEPVESEGGYTAYSLRHAAAIRLAQAAVDGDFLHGNLQAALAETASALGHSYPVFLSCYVGTAALLLLWPAICRPESEKKATSENR